ncbi:MAG TPA: hypothetical protein VN611_03180 [Patescibacteria group bacterium]|nr:hypothetical protein [Patescibacteria group bacterium]
MNKKCSWELAAVWPVEEGYRTVLKSRDPLKHLLDVTLPIDIYHEVITQALPQCLSKEEMIGFLNDQIECHNLEASTAPDELH